MTRQVSNRLNPLITALHYGIRRLPIKRATALMAWVMSKGGDTFVKTANVRRNITEAFPDLDEAATEALTREMLANFGRHVAEIAHMADFRDGRNGARIDWTSRDDTAFPPSGPTIYVGAHLGSWELCPLVFQRHHKPVTIIYTPNSNPSINNLILSQRNVTGANYVEKVKALRPCFQALDRGESVALLVDQRVNPGMDVQFFGQTTAITRLPARLATGFDCPIVPFEVIRQEPGHLQTVFHTPILPRGRKGKEAEFDLTQQIANVIEDMIIRNADTWFCSKLRWKRVDRERNARERAERADAARRASLQKES